jgi:branched-subunit amino acid aminotransferase/4-amino-4-deoxychorismate lyase
MKGGYFLLNGRFHKEEEAVFTLEDLSNTCSGFREQFRSEHNEVLFAPSICQHLIATAETTGIDLTGLIDPEGKLLRKDVSRLLNKNKLYLAAKIEILVFASIDRINFLLRAKECERGYFPLKEPGLLLSLYHDRLKEISSHPAYATSGSFLRQKAFQKAQSLGQPNIILLNSLGFACECIHGSFAMVNENQVTFPASSSGGYRTAILEKVILAVQEAGFSTSEKEVITPDELLLAEELFLFDSSDGIQTVLGLEDRRYFGTKTQWIAGKFSALARKDREEKEKG